MTMAAARRALIDLALSIEVHPLALGVAPEGEGQVVLPNDFSIEVTLVNNVIMYNDCLAEAGKMGMLAEVKTFQPSRTAHIPPLIKDLRVVGRRSKKGKEVQRGGKRLDAVVVVEHRNLKDVVTGEQMGTVGENVIIVMVRLHYLHPTCSRILIMS